jgi:hypothetical protein
MAGTGTLDGQTRARWRGAAVGVVLAVLAAAPASAMAQNTSLDSAPVPGLCEHPAGQLSGGTMPGIEFGHVTLDRDSIVTGNVRGASAAVSAAVVACSQGGVAWPDNVLVWDTSGPPVLLAAVNLFDVTRGGREQVHRLRLSGRRLVIDVNGIRISGDLECCGTNTARLTYEFKQGSLRLHSRKTWTARATAQKLIRAVRAGNRRAAGRLASPAVVRELFNRRRTSRVSLHKCYGRTDGGLGGDQWWMAADVMPESASRGCLVATEPRDGSEGGSAFGLYLAVSGFNTWKAISLRGIAG